MNERTKDYICDFVNECELHIDNALQLRGLNEVKAIQFLNQAFICVQKLKELAYQYNSYHTDQYCRLFWHFNEFFLSEPVNEDDLLNERKNLKRESSDIFKSIGTALDGSNAK